METITEVVANVVKTKKCAKCNVEKSIDLYCKDKRIKSGYNSICKECRSFYLRKCRLNKEWAEKDKERHRREYHILGYKGKLKLTKEKLKEKNLTIIKRYPEKYRAGNHARQIKRQLTNSHFHHWSYNQAHWKDIIELSISDHFLLHRHIVYNKDTMMYIDKNNGALLNTKESHIELLSKIKALTPQKNER